MDPKLIKAALDAIEAGDADAAKLILKDLIAAAAGAPADTPAPPADSSALGEGADPPVDPEKDPKAAPAAAAQAAADTAVMSLVPGSKSAAEARAELARMRTKVNAWDTERAEEELVARQALITELVDLRAETPVTAWAGKDETERAKRQPIARLASEPIAELRARVVALREARPEGIKPPPSGNKRPAEEKPLSAAEKAYCKRTGITEADFSERKRNAVTAARA